MTKSRGVVPFAAVAALAFLPPLFKSLWIAEGHVPAFSAARTILGIVFELVMLALMYFVLRLQGKGVHSLGAFKPTPRDFLHGVALFFAAYGAMSFAYWAAQYLHFFVWHSWFQPFSHSEWLFGNGPMLWPLLLVSVNPIFEEAGVRAWFTNEIEWLQGNIYFASICSWLLQTVTHIYQGPWNMYVLAAPFLVLTVYYARRRRVFPIVMAHLLMDFLALGQYMFKSIASH